MAQYSSGLWHECSGDGWGVEGWGGVGSGGWGVEGWGVEGWGVKPHLLGEKTRELMRSPPLRVYRCLASFRSHSMAFPSCTGGREGGREGGRGGGREGGGVGQE